MVKERDRARPGVDMDKGDRLCLWSPPIGASENGDTNAPPRNLRAETCVPATTIRRRAAAVTIACDTRHAMDNIAVTEAVRGGVGRDAARTVERILA